MTVKYSLSSGHLELIQNLTWDGSGSRLLSSDLSGVCKLWAMKVSYAKKRIGDLVSKETVCCVGGKVKHENRLSTARLIR